MHPNTCGMQRTHARNPLFADVHLRTYASAEKKNRTYVLMYVCVRMHMSGRHVDATVAAMRDRQSGTQSRQCAAPAVVVTNSQIAAMKDCRRSTPSALCCPTRCCALLPRASLNGLSVRRWQLNSDNRPPTANRMS